MNRRAALLAVPVLFTGGCFAGGGGADEAGSDRLRVALGFPPVAALSPWTDDALLLTRMGAAETLVTFDDSGAAEPQLAESWQFTDDRTALLELRDDVVFHDGTPMDAEAVAGSLNAAAGADPALRVLRDVGLVATAVDEDTVQLQAAQADPLLVQRLGAPSLVILSPEAYADPTAPDPVGHGTGPFEITAVQGAQSATLDAAADHWAGDPAAAGVDVRFVDDADARTSSLRAGELDVAQGVPIAQLTTLTDDQRVVTTSLPRLTSLQLNTAGGVFADPAVRAAAVAAVDVDPVVDGVFEGQADPAPGLLTDDTLGSAVRTTPTLPAAGDPAGASIRLATYDDRPELPEAAAVIAEQLRAAGFTVEVVVQTYATIEPDLLAGSFDAFLGSRLTLLDTGDPVGYLATDYACDGGYNLARLCDPAVDAAVAAAAALTDPRERRQAAADVEAQVLSAAAVVPVLFEQSRTGVGAGVQGVGDDPFERQVVTVAISPGR
ncbi:peptide/nickel transport system substrate-binding protein [Klenkia marina]|uniref:Peptide/nickel transport system substrate-binding protein n=1 Tax=Klenkia marina TaxID=1960309 RepID=A0A1G4YEQ3_9ACTN|nr:ABC transporter substrate-binding protein [Klenkia marina]SCX51218.1 peptide/nickel transport system substrate-binding protein [Klenkia marina]